MIEKLDSTAADCVYETGGCIFRATSGLPHLKNLPALRLGAFARVISKHSLGPVRYFLNPKSNVRSTGR